MTIKQHSAYLPVRCAVVFLGFDFCKRWMRKSEPKENTEPDKHCTALVSRKHPASGPTYTASRNVRDND